MLDQQPAFQLKGSLFTLTILQLINPDEEDLMYQLTAAVKQAPKFFQSAPIVIDLQKLAKPSYKINFNSLCKLLRSQGMIPLGICGGTPEQQQAALTADLAVLPISKNYQDLPSETNTARPAGKTLSATTLPTKIITQPVRSGQQIYAKNADLIVIAAVSHGAELLADGNIHVYGTLRGRALAGINGNKDSRIFCQQLDAELVSIAGLYRISDDFSLTGSQNNIQIYLEDDRLHIVPI